MVQPWCGLQLAIHILVGDFLWCNLGVGYNWLYIYLWVSLCSATSVWVTTGYTHILVGEVVWSNFDGRLSVVA